MLIYIGADHRGFAFKKTLTAFLQNKGEKVIDVGDHKYDENDDYPDFAAKVAKEVSLNPTERRGILICASGVGVDVVANKFKGIRSALVSNPDQAYSSRNDDDANILSLAADFINENQAKKILEVWLGTPFSGDEGHKRRLEKISSLERKQ